MKSMIGLVLACGVLAGGCLGTGGPVGDHEQPIVTLSEAQELYSADGCSELRGSGLGMVEVPVEGSDDLVAVAVEGLALCAYDVRPDDVEAFYDPGLANLGGYGAPTSQTDQEPHPEPAGPGVTQEPHPEPAQPAPLPPSPIY
jgi:hypothetical protein